MRQTCAPPLNGSRPAWLHTRLEAAVAAALILLLTLILAVPSTGKHAAGMSLHRAVSSLATAIKLVEASYADLSLQMTDRHLGLPRSATSCRRLTLSLPETGHARLTCELRTTAGVQGTLVLLRSPDGAWQCRANVSRPQMLPAACSTQPSE